MEIKEMLFGYADSEYRDFNSALIPTVSKEKVIGVRVPILRKLARAIYKKRGTEYINGSLPHAYYEENLIHAFIIEMISDFSECISALDEFLPYVDNWAVCDSMSPRVFKKHKDKLITEIKRWLKSESTYTVRFAIKLLMTLYLKEDFKKEYLDYVIGTQKEGDYYINMMVAWYFEEALYYRYDDTIEVILEGRLLPWVHNKAISKVTESNKFDLSTKNFLKTKKIKNKVM